MVTRKKIRDNLDALTKLIEQFHQHVGDHSIDVFLTEITSIEEQAKHTSKQETLAAIHKQSAYLKKKIHVAILNVLINLADPLNGKTEVNPVVPNAENILNPQYVDTLRKALQNEIDYPKSTTSSQGITHLMTRYRQLVDKQYGVYPVAETLPGLQVLKVSKKKKSRLVDIAPPEIQPTVKELVQKRKDLRPAIKERREVLDKLLELHRTRLENDLSKEQLADPLIKDQVHKIKLIYEEQLLPFVQSRQQTIRELSLIRKWQTDQPIPAEKKDALQSAQRKHGLISGVQLYNKLLKLDQNTLDKYDHYISELNQATNLISHRIIEMESVKVVPDPADISVRQHHEEPTKSKSQTTNIGARLQQFKLELALQELAFQEITTLIEQTWQRDTTLVDDEPAVRELLHEHNRIYKEAQVVIENKKSDDLELNGPLAHQTIPLESDRIELQITHTKAAIEQLGKIKNALMENKVLLSRAELETEKERQITESTYQFHIERGIREELENLATIKKTPAYYNNRTKQTIDDAEQILKGYLKSYTKGGEGYLKNKKYTRESLLVRKALAESNITKAMAPIEDIVKETNMAFYDKLVQYDINTRIAELEALKSTDLAMVGQCPGVEDLKRNFNSLPKPRNSYVSDIVSLDFERLRNIHLALRVREEFARQLQQQMIEHQESPEVATVDQLIRNIDSEKTRIEHKYRNREHPDPRLAILDPMLTQLRTHRDDYTHLKIDKQAFIGNVLNVIHGSLADNKLARLTNDVLHPFLRFFREKLFQPVSNLIKRISGNTYKPSFFANKTESDIGEWAQDTHEKLRVIHTNLERIEHGIPMIPDNARGSTF
ncbi:hypothetical protein [Legionella spiritensis]|uniref:hypothetical protein n=1 Tax=Legionella spiritensis TaxID=452 RepID=UPI000F6FE3FD|nr:hypothetical protein [Legionella spiritensis]VEG90918.1 Uncharacterised protein [Legionella spiritensis]